jgi:Ion transport protein
MSQASFLQTVCMQAMLLLFELTTMDNWPTIMHSGMDAAGVDVQPVTNRSSSFSLFFVVFICVSAFFLTRAFIGVFIKQVGALSMPSSFHAHCGLDEDFAYTNMCGKPITPRAEVILTLPLIACASQHCLHMRL